MNPTEEFIKCLEDLKEGDRSRLRRLAGKPLDDTLSGFDLFTGLWWPLRQRSRDAPRRETSWLVAKLYGAFPIPHVRADRPAERPTLPRLLGRLEPRDEYNRPRFRARFDALLCSPLPTLEPHLSWALRGVASAVKRGQLPARAMDWAQLLDDLSIWDRGTEHRRNRDIRDIWAEVYLNATVSLQGADHAD
jgi:CRISPR type I-E-associated protein CasB/Cse2